MIRAMLTGAIGAEVKKMPDGSSFDYTSRFGLNHEVDINNNNGFVEINHKSKVSHVYTDGSDIEEDVELLHKAAVLPKETNIKLFLAEKGITHIDMSKTKRNFIDPESEAGKTKTIYGSPKEVSIYGLAKTLKRTRKARRIAQKAQQNKQ